MATEDGLSVVLSEFARTLVTDFPSQGILDHLVQRIVDILPIDAAGVTLIDAAKHPVVIAGSDESAIRYEHLQTTLGEGPCIAAYETDQPISIADLHGDDRFPRFIPRALSEGLAAAFTFPLRSGDRCLGALDLYRTTPGPLDPRAMGTAQTLADVATAYLLNAEARAAKSVGVADLSHELKTPLTSITICAELLAESGGDALTPGQTKLVQTIGRNILRLTGLVDDLLALAMLEDEGDHHRQVEVDLRDVVGATQESLRPVISVRGLDVTFEVPDEPVLVRGDRAELESMVLNLMSNAVKFTADDGWARCRLQRVGGEANLEISDNGLGIPADEQRELFSRFFRSTTARSEAIPGTGLGLSIVKTIVESHGGQISVESTHLEGTTFAVTLPTLDRTRLS